MKTYTAKIDVTGDKKFIVDDMFLTKDMPTTAGSKMLDGYMSLFEAEVITRLKESGYELCGKADVGEFAFDLLGESSYNGKICDGNVLLNASAEILKNGEADFSINLDVNGYVRRSAAQNNLVSIKPTYGTVSRFGTIPVACSGETVSVMAKTADTLGDVLSKIKGN